MSKVGTSTIGVLRVEPLVLSYVRVGLISPLSPELSAASLPSGKETDLVSAMLSEGTCRGVNVGPRSAGMPNPLVRLWKDQKGQDLLEYALLLLLIALMLVASVSSLSQAVQNAFRTVTNSVAAATTPGTGGNGNGTGGGGAP